MRTYLSVPVTYTVDNTQPESGIIGGNRVVQSLQRAIDEIADYLDLGLAMPTIIVNAVAKDGSGNPLGGTLRNWVGSGRLDYNLPTIQGPAQLGPVYAKGCHQPWLLRRVSIGAPGGGNSVYAEYGSTVFLQDVVLGPTPGGCAVMSLYGGSKVEFLTDQIGNRLVGQNANGLAVGIGGQLVAQGSNVLDVSVASWSFFVAASSYGNINLAGMRIVGRPIAPFGGNYNDGTGLITAPANGWPS